VWLQLRGGSGEALAIPARSQLRIALIRDPLATSIAAAFRATDGDPQVQIAAHHKLHQRLEPELLGTLDAVVFAIRRTRPGLTAVARLCAQFPTARALVVQQNATGRAAYRFLRAGARGYLAASNIRRLRPGIGVICAGGLIVDPDLAREVWRHFATVEYPAMALPPQEPPSARELDILRGVAKGFSNREVGEMLALRRRSLRNHLSRIYRKLNVRTRVEAALFALRAGWIEP